MIFDAFGLFVLLAGFVVGLGAVTVIDIHGWLGRTRGYWSEATTRTHKVTKPLIWLGLSLALVGGTVFYWGQPLTGTPLYLLGLATALVLNGCWLTFRVSPYLLKREREGRQAELLPASWQRAITVSFVISFVGWWGALGLVVLSIVS